MSTLLAAVDGDRLLWLVRGQVSEGRARATEAHADGDRAYELALLVDWLTDNAHPARLEGAVRRSAPDLERGQVVAVAQWLGRAAATVIQVLPVLNDGPGAPRTVHAAAIVSAPPARQRVPLVLAHEIALLGLPLLDLAADLGRRHPAGRLVVVSATMDGAAGQADHDAGSIALNFDEHTPWARLVHVWSHELSHLLLDPTARPDQPIAERERHADDLGRLLVEFEPLTVAAAGPLVDQVRRGRLMPILGDLPSEGVLSLFAFYRLLGAPLPVPA